MSQGSRPAGQCARAADGGLGLCDTTETGERDTEVAASPRGTAPTPRDGPARPPRHPTSLHSHTPGATLSELRRTRKSRVSEGTGMRRAIAGLRASALRRDPWSPCAPSRPSRRVLLRHPLRVPHTGHAQLPRDTAAGGGGRSPATLGVSGQPQASRDLAPQSHSARALFPHLSSGVTSSPCRDCARSTERPGRQPPRCVWGDR